MAIVQPASGATLVDTSHCARPVRKSWWLLTALLSLAVTACGNDGGSDGVRYESFDELADAVGCRDLAAGDEDESIGFGRTARCQMEGVPTVVHLRLYDAADGPSNDETMIRSLCDEPIMQQGDQIHWLSGARWVVNFNNAPDVADEVHSRLSGNRDEIAC